MVSGLIVDGSARDRMRARLLEIVSVTHDLVERPDGWNRSLAGGTAGVAVFLNYLPRDICSHNTQNHVFRLLTESLSRTWSNFQGWSLFEGETGIYWALAHCARDWQSCEINDILTDVDQRTLTFLKQLQSPVFFDLVSGVVGIGAYALERLPQPIARQCIELVVDHLDASAECGPKGLCWPTTPEFLSESQRRLYADGYVDLGMAHGMAGVLAFLSLAHATGIRQQSTRRLVQGGLDWLFQTAAPKAGELQYPFQITRAGVATGGRNAWCYGDAGIASTFFLCAQRFARPDWERIALGLARSAADCRGELSGVVDGGLCHGASGLAHIFNRLYHRTGDQKLRSAARYWFDVLLDMRIDEGLAGYAAWGTGGWLPERGLVEGIAGVGLALLAALTEKPPAWDRVFLLS